MMAAWCWITASEIWPEHFMIEYDPQPLFNAGHPSKASDKDRENAAAELARLGKSQETSFPRPPSCGGARWRAAAGSSAPHMPGTIEWEVSGGSLRFNAAA
jgi:hypothetical protein